MWCFVYNFKLHILNILNRRCIFETWNCNNNYNRSCSSFAIIGFIAGAAYRKKTAEAKIGSAKEEATRIINQAMTTAEQKKKKQF